MKIFLFFCLRVFDWSDIRDLVQFAGRLTCLMQADSLAYSSVYKAAFFTDIFQGFKITIEFLFIFWKCIWVMISISIGSFLSSSLQLCVGLICCSYGITYLACSRNFYVMTESIEAHRRFQNPLAVFISLVSFSYVLSLCSATCIFRRKKTIL